MRAPMRAWRAARQAPAGRSIPVRATTIGPLGTTFANQRRLVEAATGANLWRPEPADTVEMASVDEHPLNDVPLMGGAR